MRSVFLALEGTDAAGKSSQISLLQRRYEKQGRTVATIHFPRLDHAPYGEMIASFLRGEYGTVDAVHPRLAALLYALDRREAKEEVLAALANGGVLLADRYTYSNIAYQAAKTPDPAAKAQLVDWLDQLEYVHHALHRPDLTLFLDTPLDFALRRLAGNRQGADRAYLAGKTDIHEASADLQRQVREEFVQLAAARPAELALIDCADAAGGMAKRETIHARIIEALTRHGLPV